MTHDDFLKEKDEIKKSLTESFTRAFEENHDLIWRIFTPVRGAKERIEAGEEF